MRKREESKGGRGGGPSHLILKANNVECKDSDRESFLATGPILQHGNIFFRGRKCLPEHSLELCHIVSVVHCQEPDVSSK